MSRKRRHVLTSIKEKNVNKSASSGKLNSCSAHRHNYKYGGTISNLTEMKRIGKMESFIHVYRMPSFQSNESGNLRVQRVYTTTVTSICYKNFKKYCGPSCSPNKIKKKSRSFISSNWRSYKKSQSINSIKNVSMKKQKTLMYNHDICATENVSDSIPEINHQSTISRKAKLTQTHPGDLYNLNEQTLQVLLRLRNQPFLATPYVSSRLKDSRFITTPQLSNFIKTKLPCNACSFKESHGFKSLNSQNVYNSKSILTSKIPVKENRSVATLTFENKSTLTNDLNILSKNCRTVRTDCLQYGYNNKDCQCQCSCHDKKYLQVKIFGQCNNKSCQCEESSLAGANYESKEINQRHKKIKIIYVKGEKGVIKCLLSCDSQNDSSSSYLWLLGVNDTSVGTQTNLSDRTFKKDDNLPTDSHDKSSHNTTSAKGYPFKKDNEDERKEESIQKIINETSLSNLSNEALAKEHHVPKDTEGISLSEAKHSNTVNKTSIMDSTSQSHFSDESSEKQRLKKNNVEDKMYAKDDVLQNNSVDKSSTKNFSTPIHFGDKTPGKDDGQNTNIADEAYADKKTNPESMKASMKDETPNLDSKNVFDDYKKGDFISNLNGGSKDVKNNLMHENRFTEETSPITTDNISSSDYDAHKNSGDENFGKNYEKNTKDNDLLITAKEYDKQRTQVRHNSFNKNQNDDAINDEAVSEYDAINNKNISEDKLVTQKKHISDNTLVQKYNSNINSRDKISATDYHPQPDTDKTPAGEKTKTYLRDETSLKDTEKIVTTRSKGIQVTFRNKKFHRLCRCKRKIVCKCCKNYL